MTEAGFRMEVTRGLDALDDGADRRRAADPVPGPGTGRGACRAAPGAVARAASDVALHRRVRVAAAGLLDGRTATTHWSECADLARRYPQVTVDPGVLYVDEGDLLTSAGQRRQP